jgi:hypothetical protein
MIKKSIMSILLIFVTISLCFGMSDKDPSEIPTPPADFHGVLIDIDQVTTQGSHISFNGHTFLTARRGSTEVYIPFEKIHHLELSGNESVITGEKNRIHARVVLRDDSVHEVTLRSDDTFTGEASFGPFRIRADHLLSLNITALKETDPVN